MSDHPHPYRAFSADGHVAQWANHQSAKVEQLTLTWENEAWTASGMVEHHNVHYVLRISPTWHVRQFLLFRDMDEADLWLGTDGHGRWGEMNGDHRTDLDGCIDIDLACTPFTRTLPIRRLPLHIGHSADITVAQVDVETLGVVPLRQRYTRLSHSAWQLDEVDGDASYTFEVDEFGLVTDDPARFRRLS